MIVDTVVLAGGRSSRMGTDKALLRKGGIPLLGALVEACRSCRRVVVVAPEAVALAALREFAGHDGVTTALEDPPFGGPVAGLGAGLAALPGDADAVLVLACDLAHGPQVARALLGAALDWPEQADALCLVDATGYPQHLAAIYRRLALQGAISALSGIRDVSVRRLVANLRFAPVDAPVALAADVDDPDAARRLGLEAG